MSIDYQYRVARIEEELRLIRADHIDTLIAARFALQDALCFAELIEAISKPDVEVYKHELRNDSDLAQRRLRNAIEEIDMVLGEVNE